MNKALIPLLLAATVSFLSCENTDKDKLPDFTDMTNTNVIVTSVQKDISSTISDQRFQAGMIRFYNREYQAAIQIFNSALSYDPMNHKARYYLGYAFLNAGYAQNAIQEWENLINLGGGNNQIRQKLNDLYFRLSIDRSYTPTTSYVLSHIYDGMSRGMHKVIRPSFMYYDAQFDRFFISTARTRYVVEMDGNGNMVRQIGRKIGDFSSFQFPAGIALKEDILYVADFKADKIIRFDDEGKFLGAFGQSGSGLSNISGPMGIHISADDYLYVVDNGNNRIQKFDLAGNWVQSLGTEDLDRPTDICGYGDTLFVSDTMHSRIIQYDAFGNIVKEIGRDLLQEPRGISYKDGILYIVDARQGIYLYHLESGEMENLGVDKDKLLYPFDVVADNKNLLYNTDFNSEKIAVYIPLELRYGNLGIDISQIWTDKYPQNFVHFRVWDKAGNPVYDLQGENITLEEEGENIPFVRLGSTTEYRKHLYVRFVIDHSLSMQGLLPELEDSLKPFLESMSGDDWVDVVNVDRDIAVMGKIRANVLRPLGFAKSGKFESLAPQKLGTALYQSVTELLNINRNKAIVLVTTGKLTEMSFSTYEENVIYTYARQNAIPIYVILLGTENRELWQALADQTFGKLYTINELRSIQNLYEEIRNSKPLEYILSYEGLNLRGLKNFWVNVHMKLKYKSMLGVDDTGYFVPEINMDTLINIEKEMNAQP